MNIEQHEPEVYCRHTEMRGIDELRENPRNPNKHPQFQLERLAEIIRGNGWRQPVTVSDRSGLIVKGHGRYQAARLAGFRLVPVEVQHYDSEEAETADMLADNRIAELAEMDEGVLSSVLSDLQGEAPDYVPLTGYSEADIAELMGDDENSWDANGGGLLSETFLVPPLSTMDARQPAWQARKRAWINSGLRSEETREVMYKGLEKLAKKTNDNVGAWAGTSIFDPVLCEIAYAWHSKPGDHILDPFAGGSVRGIVAAKMKRYYTGIDLRQEQVEANQRQAELLLPPPENIIPHWLSGDSSIELDHLTDESYQMMLSCPPYADLEVYSDDPRDLSNMPYDEFLRVYRAIIAKSYNKLAPDSFAVWVVGEVRRKDGSYYNFLGDTIKAFLDAGYRYWNESVLLTQIASKAIVCRKPMMNSRKISKVHQNVLVFVKGDAKAAAKRLGEIELADLPEDDG